jgi:hypothetical protein
MIGGERRKVPDFLAYGSAEQGKRKRCFTTVLAMAPLRHVWCGSHNVAVKFMLLAAAMIYVLQGHESQRLLF